MLNKIKHRGPDFTDSFVSDGFSMAFCAMDSMSSKVHDKGKGLVIAFDGEIEGVDASNTVNHTMLTALYEEHGEDMLNHLQGAFSFVIYDEKKEQVFAARDRLGIKPFYYAILDGQMVFASEIKAILMHPDYKPILNEAALEQYMSFQYSVLPETFFKGIFKLPQASHLIFKDGNVSIKKYWELKFTPTPQPFDKAVADVENAVINAIKPYKNKGDDIGTFLSSGVDSSFIAACYRPKKTFTVGYSDGSYSEIEHAKLFSESMGIENVSALIDPEDYFNILPRAMYYMDEPLADPASIAFYFGCELAAKHVKTVFSGEGPDEFFGGYGIYYEPYALARLNFIPWPIRRGMSRLLASMPFYFRGMGYLIRAGKPIEDRFIGNAYIFTKRERERLLKRHLGLSADTVTKPLYAKTNGLDDVTKMQFIDINLWLVGDILHQADRITAAHSLALKTPYLNSKIIEKALTLPTNYRITKTKDKIAFREAASRHMPVSTSHYVKRGFPVPLRVWLKEDKFYLRVKKHFESEAAKEFFHADKLMKMLDNHKNGRADNSRRIWVVLVFLIWYEQFFNTNNPQP